MQKGRPADSASASSISIHDGPSTRAVVIALSRASRVLDHQEVAMVERICEAGKRFLRERADALVRRAQGMPVLRCYSSDATPGTSEERIRMASTLDDFAIADRRGKSTKDFLMQCAFYKTFTSAGVSLRTPVFRDGRPLSAGKSVWNLFNSMLDFGGSLAEYNHTGISLEFFCADRGCYDCMDTRCRQYYATTVPKVTADMPDISILKQWYLSAACALHDGQNSLKSSLYLYMNDTILMREVHVIIASLRNSYEELAGHIGGWLNEVLLFDDIDDYPEQEWSSFWVALGTAPQFVDIILKLRLAWVDGRLRISRSFEDSTTAMADISMIVLAMLQFENFSDSRWLGAGPACRCLLRALMVGLESLVRFVRKDRFVSEWYIGGFDKLNIRSRTFIAVASVVSFIPEAMQTELLEDPRIPMRVEALERLVREEAAWVMNLPEFFWATLASVLGPPASTLRHEATASSVVCIGFLTRRIFRAARQMPWLLCAGCISDNLRKLYKEECPEEDTSRKIWQLMHLSYPLAQVEAAVRLMQSCPWTIGLNEQMHGQQAAIRKLHKGYSRRVLTARSMVSLLKPLLMIPDDQRRDNNMKRKLEALDRRKPERLRGMNIFVRDAMGSAMSSGGGKERLPAEVRMAIMSRCANEFANLSPCQKKSYSYRAIVEAGDKRKELDAAREAVWSNVKLRRLRSEEDLGSFDLKFSCATFSDAELARFGELIMGPDFSRTRLPALRDVAMKAPGVPLVPLQLHLAAQRVRGPPPLQTARPQWLAPLCTHRELFRDTALMFETPQGSRHFFLFTFAVQRPQLICLTPLVLQEHYLRPVEVTGENFERISQEFFKFHFVCDLDKFVFDARFDFGEDYRVFLVPGLRFLAGGRIASASSELMLDDFLAGLPEKNSVGPSESDDTRSSGAQQSNERLAAAIQKFPWLLSVAGADGELGEPQPDPHGGAELAIANVAEVEDETEEIVIDRVFEELHQRRADILDGDAGQASFPVRLLGGGLGPPATGASRTTPSRPRPPRRRSAPSVSPTPCLVPPGST